jgi:hypothetical protein
VYKSEKLVRDRQITGFPSPYLPRSYSFFPFNLERGKGEGKGGAEETKMETVIVGVASRGGA